MEPALSGERTALPRGVGPTEPGGGGRGIGGRLAERGGNGRRNRGGKGAVGRGGRKGQQLDRSPSDNSPSNHDDSPRANEDCSSPAQALNSASGFSSGSSSDSSSGSSSDSSSSGSSSSSSSDSSSSDSDSSSSKSHTRSKCHAQRNERNEHEPALSQAEERKDASEPTVQASSGSEVDSDSGITLRALMPPSVPSEPGPRAEGATMLPLGTGSVVGRKIWFKYGQGFPDGERLRGGWRLGVVELNRAAARDGWAHQIRHKKISKRGRDIVVRVALRDNMYAAQDSQTDPDGTWAWAN